MIELYGSLTIKELKRKYSSRPVGGAEMGNQEEKIHGKAPAGGPGWTRWQLVDQAVPHLHADKPGGTTGERDRPHNLGFHYGKIKLQNLWL